MKTWQEGQESMESYWGLTIWELAMRTKLKGTPGYQSCTALSSNISNEPSLVWRLAWWKSYRYWLPVLIVQGRAWDAVLVWYDTEVMCVPSFFSKFGVLIKNWVRYAAGVCWQSRYVWHKVMHTIIGGKLVLEGIRWCQVSQKLDVNPSRTAP